MGNATNNATWGMEIKIIRIKVDCTLQKLSMEVCTAPKTLVVTLSRRTTTGAIVMIAFAERFVAMTIARGI